MHWRLNKKTTAVIVLLTLGVGTGVLAGSFFALTRDLPQIRSLENFKPDAVTRIYSADKVLLAELFIEKRDPVPLAVIPDYLKKALITTEDRKFYSHSGVDIKGITRAIVKDLWAGKFVEGASTISQQLAKTLFLTPRKSLVRKIKEAILAFQLERRYTKDEILTMYLNQVYFGSGAYGVESAARIFFGKSVQDLDLAECALIAGLPKSPSRYSPLVNKQLAEKRRNIVLRQMHATGIISDAAYHQAVNEEVKTTTTDLPSAKAPYFVAYIKSFLENTLGSARLYRGGLTIFTTLRYSLQKAAEEAVAKGLVALKRRRMRQHLSGADPQAALLSLDVKSGGILAMVGGRNYMASPFNRATRARRQPGSAFKAITYAYAIEHGFAQNKLILDAPVVFKGARNGRDWKPRNFSHDFKGEMTLRHALDISQNIPAVRLMEMLGPYSVARFAHGLGIQSPLAPNLSLALGTSGVTLLELTAAYAVFPNGGAQITPFGVAEVVDRRGRMLWRARPQKRLVMSRTAAAIMTNMLQGVVLEGTARRASVLAKPVAGKTGTTNNYHDALFIGFSPSIATGVWVGLDRGGTLGNKETGARAALPIWIDYMKIALAGESTQYFDIPDGVVKIRIDPISGQAVSGESSRSVAALFREKNAPRNHR